MTTDPPNAISSSGFTYSTFLVYISMIFSLLVPKRPPSGLIDIPHDICDPSLKRGLLKVWDWRTVNPAHPLVTSTYLYNVQFI